MTAKEFLEQGKFAEIRINALQERLKVLRSQAERVTQIYNSTGSGQRDPHARATVIGKIIDTENVLTEEYNALLSTQNKIIDVIFKVTDPTLQTLLELRYICGKRWHEIAETLYRDERNVYKLHNKALLIIEKELTQIEQA